jgi:DNA-binding CsgD family transcriptional regulator
MHDNILRGDKPMYVLIGNSMTADRLHGDTSSGGELPLTNWFNVERKGRMILTRDLHLSWCNLAARQLIGQRQCLVLRDGCLRPRAPAEQKRFEDFIRDAGDTLTALCLPDEDGENHLVATAIRLPQTALVGVTAYPAWADFQYLWADLHKAFGLTPSEQEICRSLSSGLTADRVAEKMETSVKTVRTHIRHVYSKLGVSSREELLHKLLPYMIGD